MAAASAILADVRRVAAMRILFLPHALRQMSRPDRMILAADVRRVIETGELVEEYPDDPRGRSCLLFGRGHDKRPLHEVCSPKTEYLVVITAYVPNPEKREADLKTRKRS